MTYLDPKGEGDKSMPGKQWSFQALGARCCGTRGIWRELDCPKPNLQTMQADIHREDVLNRCRALRRFRGSADATFGAQGDAQ